MVAAAPRGARARLSVAGLAVPLALAGCGEYLGDYAVRDVRLVREMPLDPGSPDRSQPYPRYLRVELASRGNLNAPSTAYGLGVQAGFCPLRDPCRLIALGPRATDGGPVQNGARSTPLERDGRDGLHHYFVYVVPEWSASNPSLGAAYDLSSRRGPVCLRFEAAGWYLVHPRSNTIEVPAAAIARALSEREE